MLQSLERGRRNEIDFMNGYVVEQGWEKGVPKPSWSQGGFFYHCCTTNSSWDFQMGCHKSREGRGTVRWQTGRAFVRTVALKQLLVYD